MSARAAVAVLYGMSKVFWTLLFLLYDGISMLCGARCATVGDSAYSVRCAVWRCAACGVVVCGVRCAACDVAAYDVVKNTYIGECCLGWLVAVIKCI